MGHAETITAYVSRLLTEKLGPSDRTGTGQPVWPCRFGDEKAYATVQGAEAGAALRIMQAPEAETVDVCAVKVFDLPTQAAAEGAVAELAADRPG
jgi:hypothetical protein